MNAREKLLAGMPLRFDASEPKTARTIQSAWIEEAVRSGGAVHLEHASIEGVLNLRYTTFEKEFRLQECRLLEGPDFSYCVFRRLADFSGSIFEGAPDFRNAKFEYDLLLKRSTFLAGDVFCSQVTVNRTLLAENIEFGNAASAVFDNICCDSAVFTRGKFGGSASFRGARMRDSAFFSGAVFHKPATFAGAHVENSFLFGVDPDSGVPAASFQDTATFIGISVGLANFRGVVFEKEAHFYWANVKGPTTFGNDAQRLHAAEFRGAADFRDSAMTGDADFDGVLFQKQARFNSLKFGGTATFQGARFKGVSIFDGVRVGEDFVFEDAVFECSQPEDVEVEGCKQDLKVSFDKVSVTGSLFLAKSKFACKATFEGLKVEGTTAQFLDAEFLKPTILVNTDFRGSAEFRRAKFLDGSTPTFDGVHFSRGCYFESAEFYDKAHFRAAQFDDEAFFQGAKFHEKVDFDASHFGGLARFDAASECIPGAWFAQEVCFEHAKFDRDARFDDTVFRSGVSFREASVRVIYLAPAGKIGDEDQFQGNVNLTGCTYDRIQVDWRSLLQKLHPKDRQPYMQLEKTFRTMGLDKPADQVYLERKRVEGDRFSFQHDALRWTLDRLYRWGANYGVRPIRLVVFALVVIAAGVTVFQCPQAVRAKIGSGSGTAVCPISKNSELDLRDSVRFSLRLFLPVDVPLLSGCEPTENQRYGLKFSDWATLLRLAGWIVVPIGVASLAGLLRRVAP
jgi:uncharacterized protein YjbI with pentapeptide repeats